VARKAKKSAKKKGAKAPEKIPWHDGIGNENDAQGCSEDRALIALSAASQWRAEAVLAFRPGHRHHMNSAFTAPGSAR